MFFFASTQKKLCSPIFKDLAMALLMYETSSQNMIPLTHIQLCMSHFMWKSSQPWWNSGQWKRPRSVRFKLIIIWPAHGHHAWLRDFCPSDRFAQDWDDFTHYPVMPWVYVLGASHMVTTQGNDPEHIKDKSRFSSTRIKPPRKTDDQLVSQHYDDTQPRGPPITSGTWEDHPPQGQ